MGCVHVCVSMAMGVYGYAWGPEESGEGKEVLCACTHTCTTISVRMTHSDPEATQSNVWRSLENLVSNHQHF